MRAVVEIETHECEDETEGLDFGHGLAEPDDCEDDNEDALD